MVDMDTSWMKGSVGISSHWTFDTLGLNGTRVEYGEKVAIFDARAYAETLASAGARHCIFTLTHAKQYLPFPLAELDRILPGRTAGRDLVGDLVREFHARGIRFIAYYNHSCNGNDDVEWRRQGSPCRRVSRTANWQTSLQRIGHKARCSPSTSSSPPTGPSPPPRSRNCGAARDARRVPRPRGRGREN